MGDLRRIFIGGTGRSGTTITSRLLDAHPDLRRIPNEARFHAADGGLADVVRGEIELDEFLSAMRGHWYMRERKGREKGLGVLVPRDDYEDWEALIDFGGLVTAQVEAHVGKLTGRRPRSGLLKRLRGR